jgi:hypothetical protein
MRVRPFQTISCDNVPEGLTSGGYTPGFQISYVVEGQNIAGFDSLVIETIKTPEGVDISKYWNGKPDYYTIGQTSPDGKCCIFSLAVCKSQFGKVEKLAIKGHVTILLGTKREEKRIDLKATDDQETKVGPFSVRNSVLSAPPTAPHYSPTTIARSPPYPPPPYPLPLVGTAYATMPAATPYTAPTRASPPVTAAPAGTCTVPVMGVLITGPLNSLIEAKFHDGDQELQGPLQLGPMYSVGENTRMYSLPKPKADKFTLTLSYWLDLTKVTLPIVQ